MKCSVSLPLLRDLSSPSPYRETIRLAQVAGEAGFDTGEDIPAAEHVRGAFGAGMPAKGVNRSSLGDFDELSEVMRLSGEEVVGAWG